MIVGDMNISCSIIDHCDPGDENVSIYKYLKKFNIYCYKYDS